MPGLLRGLARTAAVAGTATAKAQGVLTNAEFGAEKARILGE